MNQDPVVTELLGFSQTLVQLAEDALSAKEAAETELTKLRDENVTLQKVASESVSTVLDELANASLLPPANREKVAALLSTHDGALEVLRGVVFIAASPPAGGTPVDPTMPKKASEDPPVLRTHRRQSSQADLADWAVVARNGF